MADLPEKKKRKRGVKEADAGVDEARITYHTPFKTFERLFNEASLDDTKRVIRAKLGLDLGVGMELAQIRGGSRIVLEDEEDFRAFCVALRVNPQVDLQVTLANAPQSTMTRIQDTDITAPVTKKRKRKQSIAPTPTNPAAVAAYATPANSTVHPSVAFSTSSIASLPPSSISPSNSTSPATITSPLLPFPSLPAPFTKPVPITAAAAPTLPPAIGVLGPTSTPKGSGKERKKDKADESVLKDTDEVEAEKEEKKEKKEKPKRVRKKGEAASAPAAPMSPAAREKAAAILERHRQATAERAKAPPRKRAKKADAEAEVKHHTKESTKASKENVEGSPAGVEEVLDLDEDSDKPKKEKKKKKVVVEEEAERNEEEQAENDNVPESAREASPSKEKKARKKKDKERSFPVCASVTLGTLAPAEDNGSAIVDMNMENDAGEMPVLDEKADGKSKLPTAATNARPSSAITRPADSSTILNAKKSNRPIVVSPAALITAPAQTKPPSIGPKQPSSVTSAKSSPPNPTVTTSNSNKPNALCPICLEPFHLRFKCHLLQNRGSPFHRRLAELNKTGHATLVSELLTWVETEKKRDQLRVLGKPGNAGTTGEIGQGGRAVVLGGASGGDSATGGLKKRVMSFESGERDEPEDGEEKEVESDVLGDADATEDDGDGCADSVPASFGKPPAFKRSLVSVQKPGEGSETTSSDSEEDEEMEPIAHNGDDGEDEDVEMNDASRASTPQAPPSKPGDKQKTSNSSSSSSTRSDSTSPPDKRNANSSQNKSGKLPSMVRNSRSFRGINDEPDGATDAVHQRMWRDTAQVLVPNSDDSEDEEMGEVVEPRTPNGNASESRLPMDRLFQHRGSPVAKGRTPGTPSRIQIMRDRHGNTAPVQKSYVEDGINGNEHSPPNAHPFPSHKLQSASQSSALPTRMSFMPRLSDLSLASMRNAASKMLKGAPTASSPIAHGPPTPIPVPPSGRVLNRAAGNDSQDDSTSSSSMDSGSNSGQGIPRLPKRQRAGATLSVPPRRSILERM